MERPGGTVDRLARRRARRARPSGRASSSQPGSGSTASSRWSCPREISRAFYEGYSNDTLWPLLHGFPSRVAFDAEAFTAYRDANRRFADAVVERLRPDDLVWIQDYQLMLVPGLAPRAAPGRCGSRFFLHVPFPPPEIFRILPQREELLPGLLGADVIGFQTHEHLGAFRRTLLQVLGRRAGWTGSRWTAGPCASRPDRSASCPTTGSAP